MLPEVQNGSCHLLASLHQNRTLDHAIRVRSKRAQEDPGLGNSNRNKSKTLETMGIEREDRYSSRAYTWTRSSQTGITELTDQG